jgi:hypothetical protein
MSWHGRTHVFTVEIFCIERVWPTCVQETHYTIQNKKKKEKHWRQACAPTRSKASTVEGEQLEKVCCSSTAVYVYYVTIYSCCVQGTKLARPNFDEGTV